MSATLSRILGITAFVERFIAALSIGGLTVVMFLDVGMRETMKEGIVWAQKFSLHLMFWAGMLGAALVSSKGSHLRPEIADKLWPKKLHPVLKFIEHLMIASFCSYLGYIAARFVGQSLESGQKNPVTDIPLWILQIVMPYTFFSMAIRHLCYTFVPSIRPADKNEAEEALAEQKVTEGAP